MNPMERAASVLFRATLAVAGTPVTYERPGVGTVLVTGVRGKTDAAAPDSNGAVLDVRLDDWLIDAARLAIGGEAIQPEPGDRITDTAKGITHGVAGSPAWRWSDVHRTRYRIHVIES